MTQLGAIKCCKGCEDRKVGCHSICERYIKEHQARLEYLEKVRKGKAEQFAGISEQVLSHTRRRGKTMKKGQP